MPAVDIADLSTIWLGDTYFRVRGPVRVANIVVTPNPVVFGDSNRVGDTQVMSQFIQPHAIGGSGIYRGSVRTDFDRFWTSRADTRFRYITLPPEAIDIGKPAGVGATAQVDQILSQAGTLYFCWGADIYSYSLATGTWGSLDNTIAATPTDAKMFRGSMYIASGLNLDARTGAGVWSNQVVNATYLAVFDNKLWRLGLTAGEWTLYSAPDGVTWTTRAVIPDEINAAGLFLYRDATGTQKLYASTDRGMWLYNGTADTWVQTEITWPPYRNAGKHPILFRDGKAYIKIGGVSCIAIEVGPTLTITPMGLDRDDGIPAEEYGDVVSVAADYNWIWALLDGTISSGAVDDYFSGLDFPMASGTWLDDTQGSNTLRAWNGGWHTLWESPGQAYAASALGVVVADDGQLQVAWGADRTAYLITMPFGIYNARRNPNWSYARGPVTHTTPWWDLSSEVQRKLVAHLPIHVTGASSTETVDVYVGRDLEETWEHLGQITENGIATILLNDGKGRTSRLWRLRFDLARGDDHKKAPLIEYSVIEFMKMLPATYGFAIEVDLAETFHGKTPVEQLESLKRLADASQTDALIEFAYQDELAGSPQTSLVRISRMQGSEFAGRERRGQGVYMLSLVAPYTEDTL